ncbi:hypothetical protein QMY64_18165 [Phocaeicola dorei]|nr:hypothetical protein QMY64_18165 [Phocaeicola dorei]
MKSNSFLRNRKALTALLLCTGFVATQPFSVMAEEIVTAVQTVQQQKQSVSGTIKDPAGEPSYWCQYFRERYYQWYNY